MEKDYQGKLDQMRDDAQAILLAPWDFSYRLWCFPSFEDWTSWTVQNDGTVREVTWDRTDERRTWAPLELLRTLGRKDLTIADRTFPLPPSLVAGGSIDIVPPIQDAEVIAIDGIQYGFERNATRAMWNSLHDREQTAFSEWFYSAVAQLRAPWTHNGRRC